jgi:bisphosphoglycerate-independent phosphoglycerate mutase (AlkP superfamily)
VQAAERGVKRIRVHTLTDGRDTEDGTSVKFMEQLQKDLKSLEGKGCDARIASGGGRMITTMDRYEVRSPRDDIFYFRPIFRFFAEHQAWSAAESECEACLGRK